MRNDKTLVIATDNLNEAINLRDTYQKITGETLSTRDFGHLHWKLDVRNLRAREVNELLDAINFLSDSIYIFMETDFTIEFDYYINTSAVPIVRGIIDEYLLLARLLFWEFDEF